MPGGRRKFAGTPPRDPLGAEGCGVWAGGPGVGGPEEAARGGGAPRLSRWKALILAAISGVNDDPPLPLPMVVGGGLLAAFTLPRGLDEDDIPAVLGPGPVIAGPRGGGLEEVCGLVPFGLSTLGDKTREGEVGDLRGLPSLGVSMAAGECDMC